MRVNISEILKKKNKGFRFYSVLHGKNVYLDGVNDTIISFVLKEDEVVLQNRYCVNGYGELYDNGECVIFPSCDNRDWLSLKEDETINEFKIGEVVKFNDDKDDKRHFKIVDKNELGYSLKSYYCNADLIIPLSDSIKLSYPSHDIKYFNYWILCAFDQVLVRDEDNEEWRIELFSQFKPNNDYPFVCLNSIYKQCVLYKDCPHLINTTNSAPKYYCRLFKEEDY